MNTHIRLETPADYLAVEDLTREAFWAFWEPNQTICNEHFLVSRLRSVLTFVPELDFVAEQDGRIVGHIIYTKSKIIDSAGCEHETLTFGPLSVLPECQNQGIGKLLMLHSFEVAKLLGYRAVLIFGVPDYYPRVGFRRASEFGITTADGLVFDPFMVYTLYDGALDGIHGRYHIDPVYYSLTEEDTLEFDKQFKLKEPFIPTPISVLLEQLEPEARKAFDGIEYPTLQMLTSKSEREISMLPGIDSNAVETIRAVLHKQGIRWGEKSPATD